MLEYPDQFGQEGQQTSDETGPTMHMPHILTLFSTITSSLSENNTQEMTGNVQTLQEKFTFQAPRTVPCLGAILSPEAAVWRPEPAAICRPQLEQMVHYHMWQCRARG